MKPLSDHDARLEAARMAAGRTSDPHSFSNMANAIYAFLIEKPGKPAFVKTPKKAASKKKAARKRVYPGGGHDPR